MSGGFNPFGTKQQEVLRTRAVPDEGKARKLLAKLQRKRPCRWVQVPKLEDPAAAQTLEALDGQTSVVLFLSDPSPAPVPESLPPLLEALIARLWKHFNRLYLVRLGEGEEHDGGGEEVD